MNKALFSRDSFGWTKLSRMHYLCSDSVRDVWRIGTPVKARAKGGVSRFSPVRLTSQFRVFDQSTQVVIGRPVEKASSSRGVKSNADADPEYLQSPPFIGGTKKFVSSRPDATQFSTPSSSTTMAEALTKKQQKALAFKNKQKSKRRGDGELEQPDVPEQDLLNDDDEEVPEKVVEKKEKAKKEVVKDTEEGGAEESEKKKGKRKKTAWDDDEEEEEGEKVAKKSKKDIKQRFILFVGKLSSPVYSQS